MPIKSSVGNPSRFNSFYLGSLFWGERKPNIADTERAVDRIINSFPSSGDGNINFSGASLKGEIQKAIDLNRSRVQIKAYFSGTSNNNDGVIDARYYQKGGIVLNIEYTP
ncbi:hypothetical protein ACFLQQ_02245 [Actinomycetota bacterium]